jgi:hypothetical protein
LEIAATSSRPFADFSKDNMDTLTRLKWRWVNNHLSRKVSQEEPQNQEETKEETTNQTNFTYS